ncbi:hypothetical protein BCR33DRAFT_199355 [Rhizoclosmatium globosum]|uniref:F-box domain-containing protein n=1 Tax=Rhizoclosmatium globosum TaxID=329046 RepID=A0A1Y2CE59_9FUNG|nr:hypothetical protein BCR33DRAFT_199355 [Rhizoclosmatium globosum]|eukprot:ORY45350.1 hypothetical protein BCR33DRAFT_199355 [Rhizoclosmatium globosum]
MQGLISLVRRMMTITSVIDNLSTQLSTSVQVQEPCITIQCLPIELIDQILSLIPFKERVALAVLCRSFSPILFHTPAQAYRGLTKLVDSQRDALIAGFRASYIAKVQQAQSNERPDLNDKFETVYSPVWDIVGEHDGWTRLPLSYKASTLIKLMEHDYIYTYPGGPRYVGMPLPSWGQRFKHTLGSENLHLRLYEILLSNFESFLSRDNINTLFEIANEQNYTSPCLFLLSRPETLANIHEWAHRSLMVTCRNGNMILTQTLLRYIQQAPNACVTVATQCGHADIMRLLIQNPRFSPGSTLLTAIHYDHIEIVRMLLQDSRVDPSASSNLAIVSASQQGRTDIVKLLLTDLRVDPSAQGNKGLEDAIERGHLGVIRALLADSRTVPTRDCGGILLDAVRRGNLEMVQVLLSDSRLCSAENVEECYKIALQRGRREIIGAFLEDERITK